MCMGCKSSFHVSVTTVPDRNNLGQQKFILAHSFKGFSPWWWKRRVGPGGYMGPEAVQIPVAQEERRYRWWVTGSTFLRTVNHAWVILFGSYRVNSWLDLQSLHSHLPPSDRPHILRHYIASSTVPWGQKQTSSTPAQGGGEVLQVQRVTGLINTSQAKVLKSRRCFRNDLVVWLSFGRSRKDILFLQSILKIKERPFPLFRDAGPMLQGSAQLN